MDQLLVDTQIETEQEAIRRASRDFAAALAATPEKAFERAAEALEKDAEANQIINDYEQVQYPLFIGN